MGGSHSGAATRGRRAATHTLIVAALALLALAGSARAAMAQPVAVITAAPAAVTHDVSPRFAFGVAGTDPVIFECRLDGALTDCPSDGATGSYTANELADGGHTFSVRATEAAPGAEQEWGPAAAVDFRVERTAPGEAPSAPGVTVPRSQPAVATAPAPAPVAATPAPARVPQMDIGTACMEVSGARANARLTLAGQAAIVRFRAPAAARYAAFTLRRARGARGAVLATLASARVARAGAAQTTRIALTRGQRRLVRSGTARLAIAYGTCRTPAGEWHWVAPAS